MIIKFIFQQSQGGRSARSTEEEAPHKSVEREEGEEKIVGDKRRRRGQKINEMIVMKGNKKIN
jgi:hypothetical protein